MHFFHTISKVSYFFFTRNSLPPLTHSIFKNFVFYFFTFWKKKYKLFFFFRKSLQATHSPEERIPTKKGPKHVFFVIFSHFGCFFFHQHFLFFFSQEKFTTHSLTPLQEAEKKKTAGEKKNTIFTHSVDFCPKCAKIKLFRVKKKYDTFGNTLLFLK